MMRPYPIYGTLGMSSDDPAISVDPPPEYANYLATSVQKNIPRTTSPVKFQFTLDPVVQAFAAKNGYDVTYIYHVRTYDVEEFSIGSRNFNLIPEASGDYPSADGKFGFQGGPLNLEDREIQVWMGVSFVHNGQVIESNDFWSSPRVFLDTPLSATYVQQGLDAFAAIRGFATQFAGKGQALVDAIVTGPGPSQVFNVLTQGFAQAVSAFVAELPTDQFVGKLYSWLLGGSSLSQFPDLSNITDPNTLTSFLLQYSGLTWDHVYQVIQQQLGAGNLAALEKVAGWFNNIDTNNPTQMLDMLNQIGNGLNVDNLVNDLESAVKAKITQGVARAGVEFAAKFVPGANLILSLSRGLNWVVSNASQMAALFDKFVSCIDDLSNPNPTAAIAAVKQKLLDGFNASIPVFMNFAASQLGLGSLPTQMRRAVEFVPTQVDTAIRTAVAKAAAAVLPAVSGTNAKLFDGKLAPERQFTYQDNTYVLWVAEVDKVGAVVKIAQITNPGVYKYIGELNAASFGDRDTPNEYGSPTQHINDLIAAAKGLKNAVKTKPQQGAGNPLPALKAKQDAIAPTALPTNQAVITATSALEDKVIADILHDACKALNTGCFAAGTKLLTKTGWRAVETIQRGDEVASRHESNPTGDVAWKVVEDTFQRTGCILHIHAGGQVIRTTPEHPFWIEGEGWTAAGSLHQGDKIATLSGELATIEEVYDTQEWEPVYNLRVADYHTYFVGDEGWGFAAWAHNAYLNNAQRIQFDSHNALVSVVIKHRILDEVTTGRNVAVVAVKTASGATEYWAANSGADRVRRYLITSDGEVVRSGTIQLTAADLNTMETLAVSGGTFTNLHSEEVLLAGLNRYGRNASNGKLRVVGFYTEYAPCGELSGSHRCSQRLRQWSQNGPPVPWARPKSIVVDVDTVQYSQLYPDSSAGRAIHRSFHQRINYAIGTENFTRADQLGAYYFQQVAAVPVRVSIQTIPTYGNGMVFPLEP
ncbi:MAG: HINT domain-containing protein [Planctomycetes bacterium]|nr:HINT domain-containing protein [Planctomycetota bacterium]